MAVFPSLPGLGWSVHKSPAFKTRIQRAVNGRELRAIDQPNPIWTFTLTYPFLRDSHDTRQAGGLGVGYDELQTLMGFFLGQQGAFASFLFSDPSDNSRLNEYIGTGDGTTTAFTLVRRMPAGGGAGSSFIETMNWPQNVSALYLNGVAQGSGWSWSLSSPTITFTTAPGAGVSINVDFTYYFLVRFHDDSADFENFMFQLWSLKQVKLVSVLL